MQNPFSRFPGPSARGRRPLEARCCRLAAAGSPSFKLAATPPRRRRAHATPSGWHAVEQSIEQPGAAAKRRAAAVGAAMRPKLLWTDPGLPPRREDDVKATVYSMAFNPSGTELVVAVANLVLVYATEDGICAID